MRIYLVRHGETLENIEGVLQGQTPGTLSEKGIEQAQKLATALRPAKLDTIHTSSLSRAFDTAVIVSNATGVTLLTEDTLRERNLGVFEGKPKSEFFDSQGDSGEPYILYRPDEGETLKEMENRVRPFLEYLTTDCRDKNVLLVAHGGINTIILDMLLSISMEEIWKIGQNNACINILEVTGSMQAEAVELNSTGHLE